MEEFTSIAIWVLMAFLVVNTSIIWFAGSDTFSSNANFAIAGLTPNNSFEIDDMNDLQNAYYNQECADALPSDPEYSGCLISNLANTFNQAISIPGKLVGSLWTFLTAWYNLLTSVLGSVPGGDLFLAILVPFFALVEFTAIFVILLKIAGIIRGGS